MEEQKYQIGDFVKVVCDGQDNDVRIAKVVSIKIYPNVPEKYVYGVSFNLNGIEVEKEYLVPGYDVSLFGWIESKLDIKDMLDCPI